LAITPLLRTERFVKSFLPAAPWTATNRFGFQLVAADAADRLDLTLRYRKTRLEFTPFMRNPPCRTRPRRLSRNMAAANAARCVTNCPAHRSPSGPATAISAANRAAAP